MAAPEDPRTEAGAEEEIVDDEMADGRASPRAWHGPSAARWALFAFLAIAVIVLDQVAKNWIIDNVAIGTGFEVLGSWLAVVHGRNSGILFGMLPQTAPAFAIVSLGVIALIVVFHARAGRGIVMTIATGLLLGGAIGNLLDRLRWGAVIDWIDMGIGTARFWTYNIGDAAITTAIILILVASLFPVVAEWGSDG
jgi:signal peptidase II